MALALVAAFVAGLRLRGFHRDHRHPLAIGCLPKPARARGGELLAGIDIPVAPTAVAARTRWTASAWYMPTEKSGAAVIERSIGRARLGAGAMVYHGKVVPMVGAGWSW